MVVGTDDFGPVRSSAAEWTLDPGNFTHLLAIYGGHFLDMLFHLAGPPDEFTAIGRNRFGTIHLEDTGAP